MENIIDVKEMIYIRRCVADLIYGDMGYLRL